MAGADREEKPEKEDGRPRPQKEQGPGGPTRHCSNSKEPRSSGRESSTILTKPPAQGSVCLVDKTHLTELTILLKCASAGARPIQASSPGSRRSWTQLAPPFRKGFQNHSVDVIFDPCKVEKRRISLETALKTVDSPFATQVATQAKMKALAKLLYILRLSWIPLYIQRA